MFWSSARSVSSVPVSLCSSGCQEKNQGYEKEGETFDEWAADA